MTKRYEEPIEVTPDPVDKDAPLAFVWRGRRYDIDQRLTSWRQALAVPSRNGSGVNDREYFRVLARPAGSLATGDLDPDGFMRSPCAVYDLYRDRVVGSWCLARVWD